MNPDIAALGSAAAAAEEALALERQALAVLRDGWSGDSAAAAADFLDAHCREGEAVVAALTSAAQLLAMLADAPSGPAPGLEDGPPSNFASPVSPPASAAAPSSAPAMSWPAIPMPTLPDLGGAIAGLVAQAVDALAADPAAPPDVPASGAQEAGGPPQPPAAHPVHPAAALPATAAEPFSAPPAAPVAEPPLLAAEIPPPDTAGAPAAAGGAGGTPCEIAADELPQVGE